MMGSGVRIPLAAPNKIKHLPRVRLMQIAKIETLVATRSPPVQEFAHRHAASPAPRASPPAAAPKPLAA